MTRRRASARDLETVRVVNAALSKDPVDATTLRKVAAVRGLVSHTVRARVWPTLLGVQGTDKVDWALHVAQRHKDSATVACDVERSLWCVADAGERAVRRAALARILNGVVSCHTDVHYYQGLHDVAAVLLLVAGEASACRMLAQLARSHLRDCTRETLEPVTQLLDLLFPLLEAADPELHAFLQRSGVRPFFALSWVLTWHAHVADFSSAVRLFDLFLSSSPLMPLYVGVAALLAERARVLALPCDGAELHRHLTSLDVLGVLSADQLAAKALHMHRAHPPAALCRRASVRLPPDGAVLSWPFTFVTAPQRPARMLPRGLPAPQVEARPRKRRPRASALAVAVGVAALVLSPLLGGGLVLRTLTAAD